MTNDIYSNSKHFLPFVFRFAERIDGSPSHTLRYDESRQITQVFIDGTWVDTPDAPGHVTASTRITKVHSETTDDQ